VGVVFLLRLLIEKKIKKVGEREWRHVGRKIEEGRARV
jgi:hypothetical protein